MIKVFRQALSLDEVRTDSQKEKVQETTTVYSITFLLQRVD